MAVMVNRFNTVTSMVDDIPGIKRVVFSNEN